METMRDNLMTQLLPWIEQFVDGLSHLEKDTRKHYRRLIGAFVTYLKKNSMKKKSFPLRIKQGTITSWLNEMTTSYSLYTIVPNIGRVSRFLSFLEKSGCLERNPLGLLQKKYPRKGLKEIVLALVSTSPQKSLQALKPYPRFASPLGDHMQRFISLHQSQGKKYQFEEHILCRFDRFLSSYPDSPMQLSDSIIRQWLSLFSRCRPATVYSNFMVIRQFCIYLRRFDSVAYLPSPLLTPSPPPPFFPHIYYHEQIVALLKSVRQLKPSYYSPLRPQMFYILTLLLYTTGIRLGEALRLRLCDIDWKNETLYIRETKFFKSRLVPLSHSMTKQLEDYVQLRQRDRTPTDCKSLLFQKFHGEGPYSNEAIGNTFRRLLKDMGLKPTWGHSGPRIHDLRHTFAVHRLEDWYRSGKNVQSRLGLLSTYLGHVTIGSTQRYLTMTTELLQQASHRFNQYFASTQTQGESK